MKHAHLTMSPIQWLAGPDGSEGSTWNVLAGWGKARAFDIQGRVWVDVDDPAAFRKAEELLESGRL